MIKDNDPINQRRQQRKHWMVGTGLFFTIVVVLYCIYWLFISQFQETTDDAYVGGNLVQIMSQVSGRVTAIYADETNLVQKGQKLFLLDKIDAEIGLKESEAKLARTVREVAQMYKNANQLQANVSLQQDNLLKAQDDYQRRQGLILNKTISREDLFHAKIQVDTATAALEQAKEQFNAALTQIANTDLYHHPQVLAAANEVRNAYLSLARTTIYSPASGIVAKRTVQVGQQITSNTVLMIVVPLNQLWINANFKESQLKNIRMNQPVKIESELYGSSIEFKGHIIGLNPGTGSTFDLLPPQNATGNWIKIVQRLPVRIAIDPDQLTKYPLMVGLSMTCTVDTSDRSLSQLATVPQTNLVYQTENYGEALKQADILINNILQANAANISYAGVSNVPAT